MERLTRKKSGVAPLQDNHTYTYKISKNTFLKLIGVQSNHSVKYFGSSAAPTSLNSQNGAQRCHTCHALKLFSFQNNNALL